MNTYSAAGERGNTIYVQADSLIEATAIAIQALYPTFAWMNTEFLANLDKTDLAILLTHPLMFTSVKEV